uniref:Uncharacterized protein n=1 Tax=Trypanosoma vivax (strain Y486) TaxID=1055687 RepID=G0TZV7_TRYVY|nr:hypothetical protein, unlikely [Trypanosoma vivax Y486]
MKLYQVLVRGQRTASLISDKQRCVSMSFWPTLDHGVRSFRLLCIYPSADAQGQAHTPPTTFIPPPYSLLYTRNQHWYKVALMLQGHMPMQATPLSQPSFETHPNTQLHHC